LIEASFIDNNSELVSEISIKLEESKAEMALFMIAYIVESGAMMLATSDLSSPAEMFRLMFEFCRMARTISRG
jgi:hypothetical protein